MAVFIGAYVSFARERLGVFFQRSNDTDVHAHSVPSEPLLAVAVSLAENITTITKFWRIREYIYSRAGIQGLAVSADVVRAFGDSSDVCHRSTARRLGFVRELVGEKISEEGKMGKGERPETKVKHCYRK